MMTNAPLDMDLTTVKTDFPLLADGHYDLVIKKSEVATSSKGGKMWKLELKTITPALSRTGEQIAPGSTVFDQAMLEATGNSTNEIVQRGVGAVLQAILPPGSGINFGNIQQNIPTFTGKTLRAQIGYEPAQKGYREKNVVAKYVKLGATA